MRMRVVALLLVTRFRPLPALNSVERVWPKPARFSVPLAFVPASPRMTLPAVGRALAMPNWIVPARTRVVPV